MDVTLGADRATSPAPTPATGARKRDWGRAWRAVRALMRDSERTDQVFEILDALESNAGERSFQEFVRDPEGLRQLRERPCLLDVLSNQEQLATLPDGSFGRAYLDFMLEAGLNARGLIEAEEQSATAPALDPDRQWLADRGRDSHDLWHVLTGYGRDEAGEAALLAFTYANYRNIGILLILVAASVIGPKTPTLRWERYLWQAYRRGQQARLDVADYEGWLALPLEDVRARASIVPPDAAHPGIGIAVGSREPGQGTGFGLRSQNHPAD